MKSKVTQLAASLFASIAILSGCNSTFNNSNQIEATKTMKALAIQAQDAFFKDYDESKVKTYFRADYIQHNSQVPTGIETVLNFLPALKAANTSYQNHRILADGKFIVMHNTYNNAEVFGAKDVVTFDIWRMQDGQVAEHWDAIAPIVPETASGRSQFDGPTEIIDLEKTQANKQLIKAFMDDVFFGKAPEKIDQYISSTQYDQHNPLVKDGLDGLKEALAFLASQNNMFEYHKVHRILGEGNFVLTQSEGHWNGKAQAFYDLFRNEDGLIVEHWDIIQEIPNEMAHNNGMF